MQRATTKMHGETTIFKISRRNTPYVVLDKAFLSNENLSWKAKGLLAYLLSKPDDWQVIVADLIARSTDQRDAVYTGLKELEQENYIVRTTIRNDQGQLIGIEYAVYETPYTDFPDTAFPDTENPTLLINDYDQVMNKNITRQKSKKKSSGEKIPSVYIDEIYDAYPRKVGHKAAKTAIEKALHRVMQDRGMTVDDAYAYLHSCTKTYHDIRVNSLDDIPPVPHPGTWYNQERYKDNAETWKPYQQNNRSTKNGKSKIAVARHGNEF